MKLVNKYICSTTIKQAARRYAPMQHHQRWFPLHDGYRRLDLIPLRGKREAFLYFLVLEGPGSDPKMWKPQDDGAVTCVEYVDDLLKG